MDDLRVTCTTVLGKRMEVVIIENRAAVKMSNHDIIIVVVAGEDRQGIFSII